MKTNIANDREWLADHRGQCDLIIWQVRLLIGERRVYMLVFDARRKNN